MMIAALDAADRAAAATLADGDEAAILAWEAALIERFPGGRPAAAQFLSAVLAALGGLPGGYPLPAGPLRLSAVQVAARMIADRLAPAPRPATLPVVSWVARPVVGRAPRPMGPHGGRTARR